MIVCICPGVHSSQLTEGFVKGLRQDSSEDFPFSLLVFPTQDYPAYSAFHVREFLHSQLGASAQNSTSVLFLAFSAGVVAALGAAWAWDMQGGSVKALIALDGWGVPLYGNFPIHRFSHDYFTHWSSSLLGTGEEGFYCDPEVDHLELWRSPQTAWGWWIHNCGHRSYDSVTNSLVRLLKSYQEQN